MPLESQCLNYICFPYKIISKAKWFPRARQFTTRQVMNPCSMNRLCRKSSHQQPYFSHLSMQLNWKLLSSPLIQQANGIRASKYVIYALSSSHNLLTRLNSTSSQIISGFAPCRSVHFLVWVVAINVSQLIAVSLRITFYTKLSSNYFIGAERIGFFLIGPDHMSLAEWPSGCSFLLQHFQVIKWYSTGRSVLDHWPSGRLRLSRSQKRFPVQTNIKIWPGFSLWLQNYCSWKWATWQKRTHSVLSVTNLDAPNE